MTLRFTRFVRSFIAAALLASASGLTTASESKARVSPPGVKSSAVLVLDQHSGEVIYGRNTQAVVPIASITKLMTAVVVLDLGLDLASTLTISDDDVDYLRGSHSRLRVGSELPLDDLLRLALMASENRAAAALSRAHPGGREAFIAAMNAKAQVLGMHGSRFSDSTGLSSTNVSTAEDLGTLVRAAHAYPLIREYSTLVAHDVVVNGRPLAYRNTNGLVSNPRWEIGVSKTGFINEAGKCLVMQAKLAGRSVIIVLLDSWGKYTRTADATRIRQWMEAAAGLAPAPQHGASPRLQARKPQQAARRAAPQKQTRAGRDSRG